MKTESFDRLTRQRCCTLPAGEQIRTGYKNKHQLMTSIQNIYKNPNNQIGIGAGLKYAQAPAVRIAQRLIEANGFVGEKIRLTNLTPQTAGDYIAVRPELEQTIQPVNKPKRVDFPGSPFFTPGAVADPGLGLQRTDSDSASGSGSTSQTRQVKRLEDLLAESRLQTGMRKVGENTLAQLHMDALEETAVAEDKVRAFVLAGATSSGGLTSNQLNDLYRKYHNQEEGSSIPVSFSRSKKLQRVEVLIEGGWDLDFLETFVGGVEVFEESEAEGDRAVAEAFGEEEDEDFLARQTAEAEEELVAGELSDPEQTYREQFGDTDDESEEEEVENPYFQPGSEEEGSALTPDKN